MGNALLLVLHRRKQSKHSRCAKRYWWASRIQLQQARNAGPPRSSVTLYSYMLHSTHTRGPSFLTLPSMPCVNARLPPSLPHHGPLHQHQRTAETTVTKATTLAVRSANPQLTGYRGRPTAREARHRVKPMLQRRERHGKSKHAPAYLHKAPPTRRLLSRKGRPPAAAAPSPARATGPAPGANATAASADTAGNWLMDNLLLDGAEQNRM